MRQFEYKVVPAPRKGLKARGVKGNPARFANALQTVMNEMGAEGWEYQRTDTLPCEERQGLTGRTTTFQNVLVFRRELLAEVAETAETPLIEDQSRLATDETPQAQVGAETRVAETLSAAPVVAATLAESATAEEPALTGDEAGDQAGDQVEADEPRHAAE